MIKERLEQITSTVLGNERIGDLIGQLLDIMGDKIGHLAILGVSPAMIDDIELRGVRG
jgi:hypothetical protein